MNIDEVLQKASILHDDKARRVTNTAPESTPGITADELESGVTIERLESLRVPVYRYQTQITIHGLFTHAPDRVAGYKSLIVNQNKSLGVKYAAIDAEKKHTLYDAARVAPASTWNVSIDSSGCTAARYFRHTEKTAAMQCYDTTPDSLYIGSKYAARLMLTGGFAVVIEIGAIYARDLWPLVTTLTGLSQDDYEAIRKENERKSRESYEAYQRESAERDARTQAAKNKVMEVLKTRTRVQYTGPGYYLRLGTAAGVPCLLVTLVKKMPFGKIGIFNKAFARLDEVTQFTPAPDKKAYSMSPAEFAQKELYSL